MRVSMLTVLFLAGILLPASAADRLAPVVGPHPPIWRYNGPPQEPPFPRSEPSQAVWDAGACWSECGAYCAWGLNQCLYNDAQGACIVRTDSCDLYCQRACRTRGAPFLPLD